MRKIREGKVGGINSLIKENSNGHGFLFLRIPFDEYSVRMTSRGEISGVLSEFGEFKSVDDEEDWHPTGSLVIEIEYESPSRTIFGMV